jgi:hypothetical protein
VPLRSQHLIMVYHSNDSEERNHNHRNYLFFRRVTY